MKTFYRFLLCFLLITMLAACQRDVNIKDLDGNEISFQALRGKWVVVNYWASWCKPCYKEIPELNAFFKANKNAVVLGVSYDHEKDQTRLKQLVKRMGIKFPTLMQDPAKQLGFGHIPGLPATYVISPRGKLTQTLLGAQTRAALKKAISH